MWFSHMSVYVTDSCTYSIFMYMYASIYHIYIYSVSLTSVKCFTCVWVLSPHSQSIYMYIQQMNG